MTAAPAAAPLAPAPAAVQLRAVPQQATPVMQGHFAVFNQWTEINSLFEGHFLERFAPGAFKRTIKENGEDIQALFQHGMDPAIGDKPLGPITELREDAVGAYYEVPLLDAHYVREEVLPGLRAGLYGASFRFRTMREDFVRDPVSSPYNSEAIPERTVKEAKVLEFGPVSFPAYKSATAGVGDRTRRPRGSERHPLETDPEHELGGASRAARVRRVMAGASLVTPKRPLMLDGESGSEWVRPGRDRFAYDHPAVAARPGDFEAADPRDSQTASVLRGMVSRRPHGPSWKLDGASPRPLWQLDDSDQGEPWRI